MGLIGGWKTAAAAIASIILGLGICLVAIGTAVTAVVTDFPAGLSVETLTLLTAGLTKGSALVIAGLAALGIGGKLNAIKVSNEAMLKVETKEAVS